MPPLASLLFAAVLAAAPGNAYQAVFMRAAPGHLLHLIDAIKARMPVYQAAGEARPVLMRHAQGDQWDLVLLVPIKSLAEHFGTEKATRWPAAAEPSKGSAENEDQAAKAAGFESRNHIGPYLRQFLSGHHDTLGSVVR